MYTGQADWTLIGELKNNPEMKIPVIGNGDITSAEQAKVAFDKYGVDGIMIGRGAIGAPWIFKEVKEYLEKGEYAPLTDKEKFEILRRQIRESIDRIDEYRGILHIRRHLAATPLFKGIPDFRQTRIRLLRVETERELFEVLEEIEERFFCS